MYILQFISFASRYILLPSKRKKRENFQGHLYPFFSGTLEIQTRMRASGEAGGEKM